MRSAEEMYNYCVKNGCGKGFSRSSSVKHFKVVESTLLPDENVLCVFVGLHNYKSGTQHDNNYAYAITDKRIIMGQKKIIGQNIQVIDVNNVSDITFTSGLVFGIITIDSFKEVFNVAVDRKIAKKIYSLAHEVFYSIKSNNNTTPAFSSENSLEQIKKLKELLDIGAITQEEFDTKKKKLLEI